jgi:integrase
MSNRRGSGLGSIRKRGSLFEGRYHLRVDGVVKQASVYGRTRAEVERKLREAQVARDKGTLVVTSPRYTVAAYLDQWLEAAGPGLRPRTRLSYRQIIRDHLGRELGHVALTRLTPLHVQAMYAAMSERGKSAKTIGNVHGVLHKALEQAVKWNLAQRNVAAAVELPRSPRPAMKTLTPEEARAVLRAAEGDELEALWRLAISNGLREGELAALRWPQVDLERGVVQVIGTLVQVPGEAPVVGEPKTAAGRRSVQVGASTLTTLRAHRARRITESLAAGQTYDLRGYVFERGDGVPHNMRTIWRRWRKLNLKAGVPLVRFHDLRHTSASLMLERGVHPKVVQEMLGHRDISTTLNTYSHVLPTLHRQAADAMDALLSQT